MNHTLKDKIVRYWVTIIKYAFSLLSLTMTIQTTGEVRYCVFALIELLIIAIISNWIIAWNKIAGIVINCVLCLLLNIQMLILFFGNSFLQLIMLTNLSSIRDLEGKTIQYGIGACFVLTCSFLPIRSIPISSRIRKIILLLSICILISVETVGVVLGDASYSPVIGYSNLLSQAYQVRQLKGRINEIDGTADTFYSTEIIGYRERPFDLPIRPNIILIFTEGLSQNIIEDKREIMPNIKKFQAQSLNFQAYYNHTFATYRGLIGQLYSGYQLDNLDENHLISLQDILHAEQYHTAFINTEPNNEEFSKYIKSFNFDEVLGSGAESLTGATDSYSDKEAYEMLINTAQTLSYETRPFFLSIYTFGTHATFDSVDLEFQDGKDRFLNKFYNLDAQFGHFLTWFNSSKLSENTVLIFTADHATYQDNDFTSACPNYSRVSSMVDEIPFCIYYKGIVPETIYVNGRNSLDLAPTILDYLDISQPNYFLGSSLFSGEQISSNLDTIFNEEAIILKTRNAEISSLNEIETAEVEQLIQQYFIAKKQGYQGVKYDDNDLFSSQMKVSLSDDHHTLEIVYFPEKDYPNIWFAVWSAENGQDDKIVYPATQMSNGAWSANIDLTKHLSTSFRGEINIHVYGGETSATDFLEKKVVVAS